MKKTIIFLVLILVLVSGCSNGQRKDSYSGIEEVCLKDKCVSAKTAFTEEEREVGLMNVKTMGKNNGMLFVFEKEGKYDFWMKDTYIPLDIIWIHNNTIVQIEKATPCIGLNNTCLIYKSKENASFVLEVNYGFTQNNNISVGDNVTIGFPKKK